MTFEEMEKSLIALRDHQVVQGEILNRVELAVERNAQAIARLADGSVSLQAAVKGLAETVDRFIRGLEGDGHHSSA